MSDDLLDYLPELICISVILIGLIVVIGCTTDGTKQFNTEDLQDGSCYGSYGGEFGYCSQRRSPK